MTPWTVDLQFPLSMEFSRQEYQSGGGSGAGGGSWLNMPKSYAKTFILKLTQVLKSFTLFLKKKKLHSLTFSLLMVNCLQRKLFAFYQILVKKNAVSEMQWDKSL